MSSAAAAAAAAAGEGKEKGAGAGAAVVAGTCELCGAAARVYCGADEATLCWGCDAQEDQPCSTSQPSLCRFASSARQGGRSDEATSLRNGRGRFLASSRHRKRSPSDFRRSGSAQSGSGTQGRNCSNAAIGRNE
ncbi:hypothetical protein E2562_000432 [Oryza meyeriana var. granulata]|uniref:B box-type domain-containing protein n=1 Tax=Oryza meyeriana var. granulata TaxID=110450 RepID=A0A6G1CC61_9ORYZ|nr:hypothetical protein E2562_000432 [Oryza meyeriana var. granulata]